MEQPGTGPRWQQLAPHVLVATGADRQAEPDDALAVRMSHLLDRLARYRWSRGEPTGSQYERARQLDEQLLRTRRRNLGVDHPDTLIAAHYLAVDLSVLGKHEQARALAEDTLTRRRATLGDDDPATLSRPTASPTTCARSGNTNKPAPSTRTPSPAVAAPSATTTPTPSHSAHRLADDLRALGEHEQARPLDEDTLTRRRRTLGHDHPDTLESAGNLADDLRALGEHEQARPLDEDTLTRHRILGDDHPADTLRSAETLAEDLQAFGETP